MKLLSEIGEAEGLHWLSVVAQIVLVVSAVVFEDTVSAVLTVGVLELVTGCSGIHDGFKSQVSRL